MIIAFHGTDHKTGTTMITQCAAEYMAALHPEFRVLIMHCCKGSGCNFSPDVRENFDRLNPYIQKLNLDLDEITDKAKWFENISVIGGTGELSMEDEIHPDGCRFLLKGLRNKYDAILCDTGCNLDFGPALGALLEADRIYGVLNQTESAVKRFEVLKPVYQQIGIDQKCLILNRAGSFDAYGKNYILQRLGLEKTQLLSVKDSSFGGEAETSEKSILKFKDSRFKKDIALLVGHIFEES